MSVGSKTNYRTTLENMSKFYGCEIPTWAQNIFRTYPLVNIIIF